MILFDIVEYMESDRNIYCRPSMDVGSIRIAICDTSSTDNVFLLLI